MIINTIPALRRNFATASKDKTHQHEGKFGTLTTDGEILIASAATTLTDGVVTDPDSVLAAQSAGHPAATLVMHSFGGVVQVQVADTPGVINPGTKLKLTATGQVAASAGTAGDVIVAISLHKLASQTGGQLIDAIMVTPYKVS